METFLKTARLLVLPLFFFASNAMVHAEPVSGHVKSVLGQATLITPEGTSKDIEIGTSVASGSRIQTASDGRVVIEWMPGAYSVIIPNSNIEVSSLGYAETADGTPRRRIKLNLFAGTVFCHLKHNDGPSNFTVTTPEGVAAARGTDYVVGRHGDTTQVATFTSVVTFTMPSGSVIGVKAGVAYNVGAEEAVPMSEDDIKGFVASLQDAGLSVVRAGNGGYIVSFVPPDGSRGFSFTINPAPDTSETNFHGINGSRGDYDGLGEQPIPSTNFTSP